MASAAPASAAPAAAAPTNDKTGSIFISKDKFGAATREVGLDAVQSDALWAKLCESSGQRIIAGATAPRQDAANVNNWHWSEKDLAPWAKERLEALLVGVQAQKVPDKGWVKITKLTQCKGEASVSNRKGKQIVAYELDVKCEWKGQVEYEDVAGEVLIPYISEDHADSGYDVKLTAAEKDDDSHIKALRYLRKELPTIRERLQVFTTEIAGGGAPRATGRPLSAGGSP